MPKRKIHPDIATILSYALLTVVWFSFAHPYGTGFLLDSITFLLSFSVWALASWSYFKLNPLCVWNG